MAVRTRKLPAPEVLPSASHPMHTHMVFRVWAGDGPVLFYARFG